MLTFKQAVFVVTLSLCSAAAWAQQGAVPANNVAPPPADLEPGVNTSATSPSSSEPEPAAAPAPKPAAASAPKHARAGSPTSPTTASPKTAASAATAASPAAADPTAPSGSAGANTAPAGGASAKPGRTTTAAAPKPGAGSGKAHDSLELDTTQITGNRELPKVLYIVPWKRSDLGDLVGKPVNSLLDEVLTPVDRDVFKRQNRYYDALKPDDAKDAAGTVSDPANGKH